MTHKKVIHQIKLPLSLTIILGLIAFGLIANVLKPVLKIDEAFAASNSITKRDIKSVLNNCNFQIHGQPPVMFMHSNC